MRCVKATGGQLERALSWNTVHYADFPHMIVRAQCDYVMHLKV